MPARFARALTGPDRNERHNQWLGWVLAGVAGALNAGGFLAVGLYTSHVTGTLSAMADHLALGDGGWLLQGAAALLAFLLGATACAWMVARARQRGLASAYALPLVLEAALVLGFGWLGSHLGGPPGVLLPATIALLGFVMGLQNALITKASNAVVRTTHMTGVMTDLGIELGRRLAGTPVEATRLRMLAGLLGAFTAGALAGAFGFQHLGYAFTLPLAAVLALLAAVPVADDLRRLTSAGRGAGSSG